MSFVDAITAGTATSTRRILWFAVVAGVTALLRLAAPNWLVVVVFVVGNLPLVLHHVATKLLSILIGVGAASKNTREANRRWLGFLFDSAIEEGAFVLAFVSVLVWALR